MENPLRANLDRLTVVPYSQWLFRTGAGSPFVRDTLGWKQESWVLLQRWAVTGLEWAIHPFSLDSPRYSPESAMSQETHQSSVTDLSVSICRVGQRMKCSLSFSSHSLRFRSSCTPLSWGFWKGFWCNLYKLVSPNIKLNWTLFHLGGGSFPDAKSSVPSKMYIWILHIHLFSKRCVFECFIFTYSEEIATRFSKQ